MNTPNNRLLAFCHKRKVKPQARRVGRRIPIEIRTLILRDEQGVFAQTFSISRDLRKQKEMQESLIHAGRLAAIGELAAGVVHDLNLFANACDAMAPSEVRVLTVDIAPHADAGKSFWRCAVSDTGEGISDQEQEQVFKAFHTTKPRGKGTGLGLSIARSILKEHGGEITLASERGKGATFTVLLPALTP